MTSTRCLLAVVVQPSTCNGWLGRSGFRWERCTSMQHAQPAMLSVSMFLSKWWLANAARGLASQHAKHTGLSRFAAAC